MEGHSGRVGALAWNQGILTSGSRDRLIFHSDVRIKEARVARLHGHKQEVCGLKWSPDGKQLASGGNDNKLFVWDDLNSTPLHRFTEHTAAVKAIAWNPHQNGILASGGGTQDKKIRFWNTLTGSLLSEVDTGSQVGLYSFLGLLSRSAPFAVLCLTPLFHFFVRYVIWSGARTRTKSPRRTGSPPAKSRTIFAYGNTLRCSTSPL